MFSWDNTVKRQGDYMKIVCTDKILAYYSHTLIFEIYYNEIEIYFLLTKYIWISIVVKLILLLASERYVSSYKKS